MFLYSFLLIFLGLFLLNLLGVLIYRDFHGFNEFIRQLASLPYWAHLVTSLIASAILACIIGRKRK